MQRNRAWTASRHVFSQPIALFQFIAIFGSISAISVALYLLDRSRRKQVVSTLRFWVAAENPVGRRAPHGFFASQQPVVADAATGWAWRCSAAPPSRSCVSGAPAQAGPRSRPDPRNLSTALGWALALRRQSHLLMDIARARARSNTCAAAARARPRDAGAAPTAMATYPRHRHSNPIAAQVEASHRRLRTPAPPALPRSRSWAFAFARLHSIATAAVRSGEIAFIGTGRINGARFTALWPAPAPRNLRVIAIPDAIENTGLRKRRGCATPQPIPMAWEIYVSRLATTARSRAPSPSPSISVAHDPATPHGPRARAAHHHQAGRPTRRPPSNTAPSPPACSASA